MKEESTIQYIKQMTGLADDEIHIILNHFEIKTIKRRKIILREGKIAKEVYFILKGCIRLFYGKNGEDISAYFFTENMFAGAYDSFISQKPSRHALETLEECQVFIISHKVLQQLFIDFPKMDQFVRKVLEERFVALHELFTAQILDSPEERYLNLRKERPDLINRIPQHQIATFLGITPVSLSRIKNRLTKK
jgi:CRP-like cAMP-binding protein